MNIGIISYLPIGITSHFSFVATLVILILDNSFPDILGFTNHASIQDFPEEPRPSIIKLTERRIKNLIIKSIIGFPP